MIDNVTTWNEGLSERQRKFVEAYSANGGNALAAATVAGYSKPHPQGAENLQKPTIQKAIEALRLTTTNDAIATREERQRTWTALMRNELLTPMERMKASELLGKAQGDFIDRVENNVSGNAGGVWTVQIVSPTRKPESIEME
ncbi:MAG: Terminase small [Desulfobulbaceae bacterium]|nr:MAG: Terminase small [Desulfobulbaceae bacterium]